MKEFENLINKHSNMNKTLSYYDLSLNIYLDSLIYIFDNSDLVITRQIEDTIDHIQ